MVDRQSLELLTRLQALGQVNHAQAEDLLDDVHDKGIASQTEAEELFELNRHARRGDRKWERRFLEAVIDYLLVSRSEPMGRLTNDGADWLIAQLTRRHGRPTQTELELLVLVCRRAHDVPRQLSRFALQTLSRAIIGAGSADTVNVERMRQVLFAPGGKEGPSISRFEAAALLATNDAIGTARNDRSWNDLFAHALANHLVAAAHPAPDLAEEALRREQWLSDTRRNTRRALAQAALTVSSGDWFTVIAASPDKAARAQTAFRIAARQAETVTAANDNRWFLKRLGWLHATDAAISPAERALVDFLNAEVPGFAAGLVAAT
ncbi:MAG: hypothetical protein AAF253_01715 [Pseudomonadota bacterium]